MESTDKEALLVIWFHPVRGVFPLNTTPMERRIGPPQESKCHASSTCYVTLFP